MDGVSPVVLEPFEGISAVISEIPAEEFCGASSETNLKDLSWVGPRAKRHELVIEQVMRASPVLPAQFGTLFSSREGLRLLIERNRPAIQRFLEDMTDKEEWSVKVYLDRAKAIETRLSELSAGALERLKDLSSGQRYIQAQRLKMGTEKELNRWINDSCRGIARRLSAFMLPPFTTPRERKLLSRPVTGDAREMAANWAFLVPCLTRGAFMDTIAHMNEEQMNHGLMIETSGPWPPYSFSPTVEAVLS